MPPNLPVDPSLSVPLATVREREERRRKAYLQTASNPAFKRWLRDSSDKERIWSEAYCVDTGRSRRNVDG